MSNEDVLKAVLSLSDKIQPVVTEIAVLRERHENYSEAMTQRVEDLDKKYHVDLSDIKQTLAQISKSVAALETTVSTHSTYAAVGKRVIMWAASSAAVMVSGVVYAFWQKIIAIFHTLIR